MPGAGTAKPTASTIDPNRARNAVQAARSRQAGRQNLTGATNGTIVGAHGGVQQLGRAALSRIPKPTSQTKPAVQPPAGGTSTEDASGDYNGAGVPTASGAGDGTSTANAEENAAAPLNRILARAVAAGRMTPEQAAARNAARLAGQLPGQQKKPETPASIRARHLARQKDMLARGMVRGRGGWETPPTQQPPPPGDTISPTKSLAEAVQPTMPESMNTGGGGLPPGVLDAIRRSLYGRQYDPGIM